MNEITITNKTNNQKIAVVMKKNIETVLRFLKQKDIRVDVYLVSDGEMKKINAKFRGKNKATNVLSFVEPKFFPHPEFRVQGSGFRVQGLPMKYLGELYLAPNYIERKKENMNLMVVHGLLHLLGYTHEKKSDTIKMERAEKQIVKKLENSK